jgi:hypothetical protein
MPDHSAIHHTLELFVEPGTVVELRALETSHRTISGYYDNLEVMAEHAATITDASGVYFTLNPVNAALLARSHNHPTLWTKHTTLDADILQRRWLPIDFDPIRPAGISSADTEHELALTRAAECRDWLMTEYGWPSPIAADSGNGSHLLFRLPDLPNDEASRELVKRILEAIADKFSDDQVEVDRNIFNSARIWKLYGTWAQKGDSTADRPHRLSRILSNGGAGK